VAAKIIPTQAYSLWLDDLNSSSGSILFGGIDTKKYVGDLTNIQVYPSSRRQNVTSFTVAFTSLSATSSSGTDTLTPSSYAVAAILDSGTTLTLLPDDIAALVFTELGAQVDTQLGATVVPCTLAKNTGTLNYGFGGPGGPVIKVPVRELVLPLTLTSGRTPTYPDGTEACQLGIEAAGDLPILFGDTFLRSAYVVYDLINNRVGIAQTDFTATDSNIVEFASQGAQIPSATTATGEAAVTQTETGIPRGGGATATASVDTIGGLQTSQPTGSGLSAQGGFAKNAGMGLEMSWVNLMVVGATMGFFAVGGGVFVAI
jgi:hypothetical protein